MIKGALCSIAGICGDWCLKKFARGSEAAMKTILVVDDDVEFCAEVRSLLEGNGFNVKTAYTGWSALNIAKQGVDLICFDLKLPDFSGHYFISILKTSKDTRKTPIFIITCLEDGENMRKGYLSGANEYFNKPLEAERLMKKIGEYLHPPEGG